MDRDVGGTALTLSGDPARPRSPGSTTLIAVRESPCGNFPDPKFFVGGTAVRASDFEALRLSLLWIGDFWVAFSSDFFPQAPSKLSKRRTKSHELRPDIKILRIIPREIGSTREDYRRFQAAKLLSVQPALTN